MHAHVLELEALSEDVVLLEEVVGLGENALYKMLSFENELFMLLSELESFCSVPDLLELFFRVDELGDEFEYFLCVPKGTVQPFCPVNHYEGDVAVDFLLTFEERCVVDVGHLPREVPDGEFAVAVEIH